MEHLKASVLNSHLWITLAVVIVGLVAGHGLLAWAVCAAFWVGREHAQAERRYLERHGLRLADMPMFAGFYRESWNFKSLVYDLLVPVVVSGAVVVTIGYLNG